MITMKIWSKAGTLGWGIPALYRPGPRHGPPPSGAAPLPPRSPFLRPCYYNLLANPEVVFGGIPMKAMVVSDDAECQRLWALADRVFPAYASFRHDAAKVNRKSPIVRLTQREPDP